MSRRIELSQLEARYDLVIIGGGVTGAGVLREAVRTGATVLLVEKGDFASGTSSWSSKLVHGGLRYLKNGQWRLTLESVRERQRLINEAPGLVDPQPFLMPLYRGTKPGKVVMRIGLFLYDLMAGSFRSRAHTAAEVIAAEPAVRRDGLQGAVSYEDARTDDARLTLRLILDSIALGATALNYVAAEFLQPGKVRLRDQESGAERDVESAMVINATGAWSGSAPGAPPLRPLRGSHYVFPAQRFPISRAVSWLHPRDQRPVFAYPWEGAVVYGTTDLDHPQSLDWPHVTGDESAYLLEGLRHQFPGLGLGAADALSTYSGVRPVVSSGENIDPSKESRESATWSQPGLVCLAGGKLTTFRVTARQLLRESARQVPVLMPQGDEPVFENSGGGRLEGRLGRKAAEQVQRMPADEQRPIEGSLYSWAELRWALRSEQVVHLADLLMRRTRLGLVMEQGARQLLPRLQPMCQQELGWSEMRWRQESQSYLDYWQRQHAPVSA